MSTVTEEHTSQFIGDAPDIVVGGEFHGPSPATIDFKEISDQARQEYRKLVFSMADGQSPEDPKYVRILLFEVGKRIPDLEADVRLVDRVRRAAKDIPQALARVEADLAEVKERRDEAHAELEKAIARAHSIVNEAEQNKQAIGTERIDIERRRQDIVRQRSEIANDVSTDFMTCQSCGHSVPIRRGSNDREVLTACEPCGGKLEFRPGIGNRALERAKELREEYEGLGAFIINTRKTLKPIVKDDVDAKQTELKARTTLSHAARKVEFDAWRLSHPELGPAAKTINDAARRRFEILGEINHLDKVGVFGVNSIEFC